MLALSPQFEMARLNKAEMLIRKREDRGIHSLHGYALHPKLKLFQWRVWSCPNDPERQSSGKTDSLLRRLAPMPTTANNYGTVQEFQTDEAAGATSP